jgi:hypothetical protein
MRTPTTNRSAGHSTAHGLAGAALLGVATGMRSTAGFGMLVLRDRSGDRGSSRLPAPLQTRPAKAAAVLGMGAELVLDKLPITGSRLDPPGLIGRVAFAGIGAALAARGSGIGPVPAAFVAAGSAVVAAKITHDLRARAAQRVPDAAVAAAEDLLSLRIAGFAARR